MSNAVKMVGATVVSVVFLVALLKCGESPQKKPSLVLYCASALKPPVERIAKQYEAEYGRHVALQYGGSGTLLGNLRVAERGDLYLPADQSYIELARSKGLIDEALPVTHLRAVLAVQKGNPKNIYSLEDLLREEVSVALGNPDAASIGKHVKEQLAEKWRPLEIRVQTAGVFKPTVNEIANDVKMGTVDATIIWDSVAKQYPELEIVHVPELDHSVKQVQVAVLKSSKAPTQALHFAHYLTARDRGLKVFSEMGYASIDRDESQP